MNNIDMSRSDLNPGDLTFSEPAGPGAPTAHLQFLFESIAQNHGVGLSLYSIARFVATGGPFLEEPLAFHSSPVCAQVKQNSKHHRICLDQKNKKIARAFENKKPFLDVCPFGIQDWVVPLPEGNPLFVLFITNNRNPPRSRPLSEPPAKPLPPSKQFLKWRDPVISHIVFLVTNLLEAQSHLYTAPLQGRLPDVKAQLARHAVRYRYRSALSLQTVARELQIGKSQLARAYKKCWGSTFQQDLMNERLKHAKAQLYCGASVTEVAHEIGLHDPGYLHRLFKRAFGMGPIQWQRSNQILGK